MVSARLPNIPSGKIFHHLILKTAAKQTTNRMEIHSGVVVVVAVVCPEVKRSASCKLR